jgi:Putative S-adenosyl-L-methionine-dependent methyltransferase
MQQSNATTKHFSSQFGAPKMLVRKYIQQRLHEYYAQPLDRVVGSLISSSSSSIVTSGSHHHHARPRKSAAAAAATKIPFRYLLGEYHWNYIYGQIYRNTAGQWLTPSELFTPYYSQCIAQWIVQQILTQQEQLQHESSSSSSSSSSLTHNPQLPPTSAATSTTTNNKRMNIEIVELGGGRGTNAMNIMDYMLECYPHTIYPYITSYTIMDHSEPLLQYQQEIWSATVHAAKLRNRHLDLYYYATTTASVASVATTDTPIGTDPQRSPTKLFTTTTNPVHSKDTAYNTSSSRDETITIVIGLEILDNLPHDKIRVSKRHNGTATKILQDQNKNVQQQQQRQPLSFSQHHIIEQAELMAVDTTVSSSMSTSITSNPTNEVQQYQETFVPLTDPILQSVLRWYPLVNTTPVPSPQSYNNTTAQYFWIPTIACRIIQAIVQERPHAAWLLADFDTFGNARTNNHHPTTTTCTTHSVPNLPKTTTSSSRSGSSNNHTSSTERRWCYVPAIGEPIVTDMNDVDVVSYLHTSDTPTDILFPTNFHALASYCVAAIGCHFGGADTTRTTKSPLLPSPPPATANATTTEITTSVPSLQPTTTTTTANNFSTMVQVQKQYDFLQMYGPAQVQATTSWFTGYSPMIHDFENCSVLTLGTTSTIASPVQIPTSNLLVRNDESIEEHL